MRGYIPSGVTFTPDISNREGNEAWKLDLYIPAERATSPRPAIVFIHGGGFRAGDKRYRFAGHDPQDWNLRLIADYAKAGYGVISVNYRLSYEATFPAQVEDVKAAIRWLRANAQKLNLDPARLG